MLDEPRSRLVVMVEHLSKMHADELVTQAKLMGLSLGSGVGAASVESPLANPFSPEAVEASIGRAMSSGLMQGE